MKLKMNCYSAILAALALGTTVQAANTGINTLAPTSQLSVKGNFAVGSTYANAPNVAPINGAIIEGRTGIATPLPLNPLHVFSTGDPVRFEGLLPGTAADKPLIVRTDGVVKLGTIGEFVQVQAATPTGGQGTGLTGTGDFIEFGDNVLASSPDFRTAFPNNSTYSLFLAPGHTYKLTFTPQVLNAGSSSDGFAYQFYNFTTGTLFGPQARGNNGPSGLGNPEITTFIATPAGAPTEVRVRINFGTSNGFGGQIGYDDTTKFGYKLLSYVTAEVQR